MLGQPWNAMCRSSPNILPASSFRPVTERIGDQPDDRCVVGELLYAFDSTGRAWMKRIRASTWKDSVSTISMLNPASRRTFLIFMREVFMSKCMPRERWVEAVQIVGTSWFRSGPEAGTRDLFALSAAAVLVVGCCRGAPQHERHRALVDYVLDRASSYSIEHGGDVSMEDASRKDIHLLATPSSAPTSSMWISTFIARLDVVTKSTVADQLLGGCVGLALAVLGVLPDDSLAPSLINVVTRFRRRIPRVGPRLQPQVLVDATEFGTRYKNSAMQVCMENVAAHISLNGQHL